MFEGEPPIFIKTPKGRQEVEIGSQIKLPCRSFGAPVPHIKWYVGGKDVHVGENIQINKDGDLILQV